MLIEKEEEAKFYRDIEAGLPFSEEVANRLGMLEYARRYTSNHIDEKRLQQLKRIKREWKAKGNNWNIGIITSMIYSLSDSFSVSLSSSR